MPTEPKILALQFKYFGDAVLMTPSLRALREHFPKGELHVLVPEKIAPVLNQLPWLDRVWPMPHRRGRATISQTWPVIRALRRERFDRSVDFGGNDRGAIISFLVGARHRLGWAQPGGFLGRRFCYHQGVEPEGQVRHESARLARLLSAWDIQASSFRAEIRADPALAAPAKQILPPGKILCHLASSQSKKEWPLAHWARLHELAVAAGLELVFGTGVGPREEALLAEFKRLVPGAAVLEPIPEVGLFGPSSPTQWAPVGARHRFLAGSPCTCGNVGVCESPKHCLAAITPEHVFAEIRMLV